jgi:hypothetical protein
MITAPESKSISTRLCRARKTLHTPRPLPVWMQVGVMALLLVNGVQTALHFYNSQGSRVAQTPSPSSTQKLSGFEYYYEPERLHTAAPQARNAYDPYARYNGNMQPTFQYAGYYAHAPSAASVMPVRAYAPSTGRWTERDPLPAK